MEVETRRNRTEREKLQENVAREYREEQLAIEELSQVKKQLLAAREKLKDDNL